jgi:peptidoglycan/LPS O-acetylase OafA/YrhL
VDDPTSQFPDAVTTTSGLMRSGVAVFFVISGFVIAYTTRQMRTGDQALRFIARRQVRLDPPYYTMIAVALLIEWAQSFVPSLQYTTYGPGVVILNMLYLQNIVGVPSILAVAWTLCLEVQFYLVVVLVTLAASAFGRTESARTAIRIWIPLGLLAVSLALPLLGINGGPWFIGLWWMFALGMTLAWFAEGVIGIRSVSAILAVVVVWLTVLQVLGRADAWGGEWFAVATAVLIAVLGARAWLSRSPGRVLLYFGRISYSLYLVHLPVITVVVGAAYKVLPHNGPVRAITLVIGGAAAIGAAHLLYRFVELTALRWSKRIPRSADDRVERGNTVTET